MELERLTSILDNYETACGWLSTCAIENRQRGFDNLRRISEQGVPLDLLAVICEQLAENLPLLSDPDMALNNLERFVDATRNPLTLASLFERDREALPTLLQIFSTSQSLSDLLVTDPVSYDLLRMSEGAPLPRKELLEDLLSEINSLPDTEAVLSTLRRYKQRETLRIAYGDIVRSQKLEIVTQQISFLAEVITEAALRSARSKLELTRGVPRTVEGKPAQFVVLALGKLGGRELNYSSDIDLMLLYDSPGKTDGRRSVSNEEFFSAVAREIVRLLSETTAQGMAYRVDLRLRPRGAQGPIVTSLQQAQAYYDLQGRTWERQAFVKARPVAGDLELGKQFLNSLQPWIYRRYLSLADITGIKALKRRIEHASHREGINQRDVKTGHGGIRDIEFVIQFLQLLNGGSSPTIRSGNTLEAIAQLELAGCLTTQERTILEENYRFLRKLEHRLQMMFDLQTHLLPQDENELRKIAVRMGYAHGSQRDALEQFRTDLRNKTELNRKILDHLLHDAFGDDALTEPAVDLVNHPDPSPETIHEVLGRYGFSDIDAAYHNLMALATEKIRFLSTRRCRHFLASIAPRLLQAIASTPDPDSTLVNLSQVSDSLGGKGVLWELFSFNTPSMHLYVRLCSASPYLSSILTSNPGMLDELMDSLLLEGLPTLEMLRDNLAELCRGAEDIDPILHSFKDAQHLRVGIRDILGKDDIRDTNRALSDIAETCLTQIAVAEYNKLIRKYGQPTIAEGERAGAPCEPIILALGKLGGREPNYHSDLDVVFLYEADGHTTGRKNNPSDSTTNQHFFSELGQRIMRLANHLGPYGRLYEVDPRLRPTGRSGSLAVPIDEFERYFAEGSGQLWERQSLCKARVIFGSPHNTEQMMRAVVAAAFGPTWRPEFAEEIRQMRYRLEETASKRNLKRGPGGTVDIEFLVQMLQLQFGGENPEIRTPGTLDALDKLYEANLLGQEDYEHFGKSYRFLRAVEARIRLMDASGRHEMPDQENELLKLAYLLGGRNAKQLVAEAREITRDNRKRFERLFAAATAGKTPLMQ